jgi:uncharacterized membrane protein
MGGWPRTLPSDENGGGAFVPFFAAPSLVTQMGGILIDPSKPARLHQVAQPVLADLDMEAANVSAYTPYYTTTISKQTTAPHSGTRCLRAANTPGQPCAVRMTHTVPVGNRVKVSGYARTDGVAGNTVKLYPSGAALVSGTVATTTWQLLSLDDTVGGDGTFWFEKPALNGNYIEIDDVAVENLSIASLDPIVHAAFVGMVVANAVAVSQPFKSTSQIAGHDCVQFDGVADYLTSNISSALFNPFHATAGSTITVVIAPDTTNTGTHAALDTCNNLATNHGIYVGYDAANQQVIFRVGNGTGVWLIDAATGAGTVARNAVHVIRITWSVAAGYSILVDGAAAVTGAVVGAASASNATMALCYGGPDATSGLWKGRLGPAFLGRGLANSVQLRFLEDQFRSWAGV